MIAKIIGVILVVISCGGLGFHIAANFRREESVLRQLVCVLDFMECELKFRLTPLPDLCKKVAAEYDNIIGDLFSRLVPELDKQSASDVSQCFAVVLSAAQSIPVIAKEELELLGKTLGRFDLEGQLKGLDAVRQDCKRNLNLLLENRDNRVRSYQTLGLCAGAALAILFV